MPDGTDTDDAAPAQSGADAGDDLAPETVHRDETARRGQTRLRIDTMQTGGALLARERYGFLKFEQRERHGQSRPYKVYGWYASDSLLLDSAEYQALQTLVGEVGDAPARTAIAEVSDDE